MRAGWRRQLGIAAAGLALGLGIVVVRLLVDARASLQSGLAAEQRGEIAVAIRHYLDAARMYVPGSPYPPRALDRLDAIAVAAVTRGDYPTARAAFEAERAALLGSRSFYTPYAGRMPDLERRLARLLAASEDHAAAASFEERTAWHAQRLAEHPGPKNSWVLLALLGLGIWIASAVLFFRYGLDAELGLRRVPAAFAASGFLLGLALFLVCLRLA
jgi:hypothetical protein